MLLALTYIFPQLQSPFPTAHTLLQGPLLDSLGTLLELLQSPPSPPPGEGLDVASQCGFTVAPSPLSQGNQSGQHCSSKNYDPWKIDWGGALGGP